MHVNADSLLIRAATTSTSGTLNDLPTDLIMANNNNDVVEPPRGKSGKSESTHPSRTVVKSIEFFLWSRVSCTRQR